MGGAVLPVAYAIEGALASWLSVKEIASKPKAGLLRQCGLHAGEAEAIVLAGEIHAPALLMDDREGIQAAATAGVCSAGIALKGAQETANWRTTRPGWRWTC